MAASSKLRKANQMQQESQNVASSPSVQTIIVAAVSTLGLTATLAIVALVVLIAFIGGASSTMADPTTTATGNSAPGGDGKGTFDDSAVPDKSMVQPLKDAAGQCDLLSPAVLAAQIEVESGFDADKVGADGEKGVSQVPTDAFTKFGKDDDENGKVSALDAKDSIFAQARYLCSLADEVQKLLDDKKAVGDKLTLTLVAWHQGGSGYVKQVGGASAVDEMGYVAEVRGLFATFLSGASSATGG
jgi:hypothetical protein